MRFADEPAERVPSRQITRVARHDPRGQFPIEQGEFDQAVEELTDSEEDRDERE